MQVTWLGPVMPGIWGLDWAWWVHLEIQDACQVDATTGVMDSMVQKTDTSGDVS